MTLDELKGAACALNELAQKELLSFVISLRTHIWKAQLREAARVLDDPNTQWFTLEEAKARFAQLPDDGNEDDLREQVAFVPPPNLSPHAPVPLNVLRQEAAALDEKARGQLMVFLSMLREERWSRCSDS